jgi:hypothetical protein
MKKAVQFAFFSFYGVFYDFWFLDFWFSDLYARDYSLIASPLLGQLLSQLTS